ncbi:MAG: hypothetical protein HYX80_05855 [Chloroflexi bacterium]|nr:hypothetical protein [Chloroflexota bacterium]
MVDVKFDKEKIQRVTISYDTTSTNPADIIKTIEKNGDKVIKSNR